MKRIDHKKFEKFLNDFSNRTIYKELSLEILAALPDAKIEQAIIDYIDTKILDYDMELSVVSNMSDGFQMVYSTWALEGQVNNGGFNQFFFNPSGQFAEIALLSLDTIGATEYYEILQKAIEIHSHEKDNKALQDLYSQRTLQAFSESYKITSLGECDTAFYKLKNRLSELRLQYIRSNPHLFVGS